MTRKMGNCHITFELGQSIFTLDFEPDDSVIPHVGFISINIHSLHGQAEVEMGLRKILVQLLEEGRVKKLELFTADPTVAEVCKHLGFFVRGEKIASCYDNGEYKNELGVEFSFFNIADARKLLAAKVPDVNKNKSINEVLSNCSKIIENLIEDKTCDILGGRYLENLVYQMVRDELGQNNVFSLSDKRWKRLLPQTPAVLHDDLIRLFNRLQINSAIFYHQNSAISSLSVFSEAPYSKLENN